MPAAAALYDWLLLLHLLAAMTWFGGLIVLGSLATFLLRRGDPVSRARFVGSLRTIGPLVLAPSVVALLGFGIWLVADSDAWSLGQAWIAISLGLFAAAFVVGAAFQSRAAIGAERAAAVGDHAEAVRQLRRWTWGMWLIVALLVVATWDMVMKPGL